MRPPENWRTTMADEKFYQDIARVEKAGATRYGDDHWKTAVDALGRALGAGGIPEAGMRAVLQQPDPAQTIYVAGKEAVLAQSESGDELGNATDYAQGGRAADWDELHVLQVAKLPARLTRTRGLQVARRAPLLTIS